MDDTLDIHNMNTASWTTQNVSWRLLSISLLISEKLLINNICGILIKTKLEKDVKSKQQMQNEIFVKCWVMAERESTGSSCTCF